MRQIADLHTHSKYSRATSPDMNLETMAEWAGKKGINILATGDFTHPAWFSELKNKLVEKKPGLYQLKDQKSPNLYFILNTEISSIYSKTGKVRKIHNIIFAPNLETVAKINVRLSKIGNLWSDGRPILGLDSKQLLKIILDISPDCFLVPAHIWTPWFSLFGSMSGFDTIEECFDELSGEIFAAETGLSSDPEMNWRLSQLDRISLISNSDSHSPANLIREANVFDIDKDKLSYLEIRRILKEKDKKHFLYTIEFFPEEGKYHFDGHRSCNISFSPTETAKNKGICPICHRKLTIGVLNRVEELADADRPEGFRPKNAINSKHLIPLSEILAEVLGTQKYSMRVKNEYEKLVHHFGNEIEILLDVKMEDLAKVTLPQIAADIKKMRTGEVEKIAGFDGVYGKIKVKSESVEAEKVDEKVQFKNASKLNSLF